MKKDKDTTVAKNTKQMLRQIQGTAPVCKLNKALYGLRQAGRQWYHTLDSTLRSMGMEPTSSDPCVYIDRVAETTFVLVYVDDIIVVSNNPNREKEIKSQLSSSFKSRT